MEVVFELVEVFICVLEAYLMFDFYMAFFPLREVFRKKYVKAAAVVITAVCVRVINSVGSSTINILSMQIIYVLLLFGMFKGKFLKKVFGYFIATAIMIGSEFLWVVIMAAPPDFSMHEIEHIQASGLSGYMALLGIKIIAFILFVFAKRIVQSSNSKMNIKNFFLFSVVPISTFGIMLALAYMNIDFDSNRYVQTLLMICSILIMIGNILIFYVYDEFAKSVEQLRNQEIVITKMEMEEKRYEQIEAVNQEHARVLHDIQHYIRAIGGLVAQNKEKELLEILSELNIKVKEIETKIYCPNKLLNTILNEKKKEANEKGIEMRVVIEPEFSVDQIENMDLIVIMGNLLENAMEAAQKCEQGYMNIYLSSKNNGSFSIIQIVNNYIGEILIEDDKIKTIKKDSGKHGFGIQNVSMAAEKYDGYLHNFYNNNVFTAVVILPNL